MRCKACNSVFEISFNESELCHECVKHSDYDYEPYEEPANPLADFEEGLTLPTKNEDDY